MDMTDEEDTEAGAGRRPRGRRGQGASEFIVLLGMVLVLALLGIMTMNMLSSTPGDERISISRAYWSSATPFAIYQHSVTTDGVLTLEIINKGPKALKLQDVQVVGDGVDAAGAIDRDLPMGKQIEETIALSHAYQANQLFELNVNFTYTDADSQLPDQIQVGREPVIGLCNGQASVSPPQNCGGLLCNGESCSNPNQCQSHHCHDFGGGKKCVECIGNGNCDNGETCQNGVCV